MKIYISYFGQMRNLPPNLLPVSTAIWDAPWFKGTVERADEVVVPPQVIKHLEDNHEMCRKNCPLAIPCSFMKEYRKYLDTLDFDLFLLKLRLLTLKHPGTDGIVLMVYEKPEVKCAERPVLQDWFQAHGVELPEWHKPIIKKQTNLF